MRKARQRRAQLPLQDRLPERIATRKTVGPAGRLDLCETRTVAAEIMRAITRDGRAEYFVGETRGLHGAQRFVVDRHRARLVHRLGLALDQQAFDPVDAEQIGERQPRRPSACDDDGVMSLESHGTGLYERAAIGDSAACAGYRPFPCSETRADRASSMPAGTAQGLMALAALTSPVQQDFKIRSTMHWPVSFESLSVRQTINRARLPGTAVPASEYRHDQIACRSAISEMSARARLRAAGRCGYNRIARGRRSLSLVSRRGRAGGGTVDA